MASFERLHVDPENDPDLRELLGPLFQFVTCRGYVDPPAGATEEEVIKAKESEFNADMWGILEKEREVGLCSTRFFHMLEQYGGVQAAHRLLKPDRELPPNTFGYLRKRGRLDLAMESYVVMEKYRVLDFSDDERQIAQWRLDYGD